APVGAGTPDVRPAHLAARSSRGCRVDRKRTRRSQEALMILAGDIGGTKTHLALFDWTTERVEPVRLETFHSGDYVSLDEVLAEFLVPPSPPTPVDGLEQTKEEGKGLTVESKPVEQVKIDAACFGVAGPVIQNHCRTTNLPWEVDGAELAKQFEILHVRLLN